MSLDLVSASNDYITLGIWDLNDTPYAEPTDDDNTSGWGLNNNWRNLASDINKVHTGLEITKKAVEPAHMSGKAGLWLKESGAESYLFFRDIDRITLKDDNTYIGRDASNNMTFADVNTGVRTLKSIGCPVYHFIKATAQAEGDLHLSGADWGVSKTVIHTIRVITASTDWDLYLLQNDNGFAADDANIPKIQIMDAGNGNANIYLEIPYEDEDDSSEVHLYFFDNSGANTADIYIIGTELI